MMGKEKVIFLSCSEYMPEPMVTEISNVFGACLYTVTIKSLLYQLNRESSGSS